MGLAVPLTRQQVDAANQLYAHLTGWQATTRTLDKLACRFPEFDFESCLLKTVAVNSLFTTMVFAIWRMTAHVHRVLSTENERSAGPQLVEQLAALPKADGDGVERRFRSFASKFAHFFLDPAGFPIFDSYAGRMIAFHLGDTREKNQAFEYVAFHSNFFALKRAAGLEQLPNRDFDRYLWLAGQHMQLKRAPDTPISWEVRVLLTSKDRGIQKLVKRMVSSDEST